MEKCFETIMTEQKLKAGVRFSMGKERVWWRVLDVDEEQQRILVISDKPVCDRPYHRIWENVTWENCSLRRWLNREYLEDTFPEEERDAIMESDIETPDNPEYHTKGGAPIRDRIFLLSMEETERYFENDEERACGSCWWLRSPGRIQVNAAGVSSGGRISAGGDYSDHKNGVRPAFWINLNSQFFQSLARTDTKGDRIVRIPELYIRKETIVSGNPGLKSAEIPEGVKEIGEKCFVNAKGLKSVTIPSTVKKIGKEAFSGCAALMTIRCQSDIVSWGKDALDGCKKLNYSSDLYRTRGKLCDSFAENIEKLTPDILAWLFLYQKGKAWDEALPKTVSKSNAGEILKCMTKQIAGLSGPVKKEAKAAGEYVIRYASLLNRDAVTEFLETLQVKKCQDLSDELIKDPVMELMTGNTSDQKEEEETIVLSDGTVLIGSIEAEFKAGSWIRMGQDSFCTWRILEINVEKQAALIIADQPVCNRQYHMECKNVTWKKCSLRAWLNGEYLDNTFSEEERDAIMESDIETPDNPEYHTRGGAPTRDRIFLLSLEEAERYFEKDEDRACGTWWWLRSPGNDLDDAARVNSGGRIDAFGFLVNFNEGVRPAFWINLNSQFFQSLIRRETDERRTIRLPLYSVKSGVLTKVFPWTETIVLPEYVKKIGKGAAENCGRLQSVDWKTKAMQIEKGAFSNCPALRLPARLYRTEKKLDDGLAPYLPDDPEAIASVLKYQKDLLLWASSAIQNAGEDRICDLLDEMEKEDPSSADLEWILAAAPYTKAYGDGRADGSEYKQGASGNYSKSPAADRVADRIGRRNLAEELVKRKLIGANDHWYAPYAAYAEEDQLKELIKTMKTWEKEGKTGKERIVRVRGAILLNDSREAMRYADSLGLLGRYASLRGQDEDAMRDRILSDFGLDADGKRSWILAGKTYTAGLNSDLSVTLSDADGKELRIFPKKGAEPEAYETANKEFTALKKEIKATAKIRNDRIFADFLSGRERPGKDWKDTYMQNPLLRILARLIVWAQDNKTFILREDGNAYDVNGTPYTVTDKPVRVAHPMEMGPDETGEWQLYFNKNLLKQPFEQVWEPVVDASMVKEGRYDGCTIELYRLMNKEKHGIVMKGRNGLELSGCKAELQLVEESREWVHNKFEIQNFSFNVYNRQVNHIVVHFDKGTVESRILKDDVTVRMWLDNFTPAQISEFIGLASQNGCTNVTAMLLEYQNEHFTVFDPMEEFTLDLL